MGRLTNRLLGFPSGRAGDIVFRVRNGKPEFYLYSNKKKVRSGKEKDMNRKFSTCSSLCSAIRKINVINSAWRKNPVKANDIFFRMMKENINRIKTGGDISSVLLVPDENKTEVQLRSIVQDNQTLIIETGAFNIRVAGEKRVSVQGIVQLTNPVDANKRDEKFIPLYSKEEDFTAGSDYLFEVILEADSCELIKEYRKRTFLLNIAVKNLQSTPEKFSFEMYSEEYL
jgi:hypothetical protein